MIIENVKILNKPEEEMEKIRYDIENIITENTTIKESIKYYKDNYTEDIESLSYTERMYYINEYKQTVLNEAIKNMFKD